jgi:hypothetical protein
MCIALWTHTLACTSKNSFADNHLGGALASQGKLTEAIQHFQQALTLATAQNNNALAESSRARLKFCESTSPQPQTPQRAKTGL